MPGQAVAHKPVCPLTCEGDSDVSKGHPGDVLQGSEVGSAKATAAVELLEGHHGSQCPSGIDSHVECIGDAAYNAKMLQSFCRLLGRAGQEFKLLGINPDVCSLGLSSATGNTALGAARQRIRTWLNPLYLYVHYPQCAIISLRVALWQQKHALDEARKGLSSSAMACLLLGKVAPSGSDVTAVLAKGRQPGTTYLGCRLQSVQGESRSTAQPWPSCGRWYYHWRPAAKI